MTAWTKTLWMSGISAIVASIPMSYAQTPLPADLIVTHARIHTEDPGRHVVAAMAIRGHDVLAVGTDEDVAVWAGPSTRRIDLGGRVVLPGFIDAHTHPAESAQDLGKCSLGDEMTTVSRLEEKVRACLAAAPGPAASWFMVVQVNPSGLVLTRSQLDGLLKDRPLVLSGADGHTSWANSAALRAAGIDRHSVNPVGGRIERDGTGRPTGTLRDSAADALWAAVPAVRLEDQVGHLQVALDQMRAVGITSVQDADTNERLMQIYKSLYDVGRLDMRVRASFKIRDLARSPEASIAEAVAFSQRWAIDPEFLRADAIKIYADGVIEYPSQTAALLEPYLDAQGRTTASVGPSYVTQTNLNELVAGADHAGLTVHIHAIGDRAVRQSLDAFEYARRRGEGADNRDQIAHLELVAPADFARFKSLGVIANFQLQWAEREDYVAAATIPFIGDDRAKFLYPARSLRDAGAVIAGGSDWSVSTFNPFEAMEHAVTRARSRGEPALLPEQALTVQEVVDAYTTNAAFALRQEQITGSLEVGKRADFIVLDRDPFTLDPYELHATGVVATYLDGRRVYGSLE